MKLVKSILLGSAAGLFAVAGAQAADLPVRKAAPVEYVRVCTAYGAGFFYIPGTDTCIRVGGRARFEYQYTSQRARGSDQSGYRSLGRLNLDARTQTPYGTLRAFVRFDIASRTGGYLKSGTQERFANSFFGTGQDERNSNQKFVEVDKAFVQFMGFTAGRAASFFDFYAHDVEMIGSSIGSDVSSTNLFAYTATFGTGFSATISAEDPVFRRNPIWGTGFNAYTAPGTALSPVAYGYDPVTGLPTGGAFLSVQQNNALPDFVGALRYDQPWGSAQISAAVHELRTGNYLGNTQFGAIPATGVFGNPRAIPGAEYGYAVQGGLKLNMPQIAPGDVLWLQAGYAVGANSYTGIVTPQGSEVLANTYTNRSAYGGYDMFVDTNGGTHLTESYSGTIAFLHYWTPEIRQGVFASYGRAHFDQAARSVISPATQSGTFSPYIVNPVAGVGGNLAVSLYSPFGKDYSNIYVGSNLIWSPVRDLDIGVEAVYERLEFLGGASRGRVVDLNKPVTLNGVPRTITADDNVLVRMRVQRDF